MMYRLTSTGKLERCEHSDGMHDVDYYFRPEPELTGWPRRLTMRIRAVGLVVPTNGEVFSEGQYLLYTKRKIMKVKNLDYMWIVLS